MRITTITIALAALLVTGAAGAAGGNSKDAGKGASGPPAAAEGPSGGNSSGPADSRDTIDKGGAPEKTWDVGAGVEYHHLIAPGDVMGDVNRNVNYYSLTARWDITPYDRISFAGGVYQYFLADQGEPGVRLDDVILSYARRIPLPGEVNLRISPSLILPTSFGSQKSHIYVVPRLGVSADRKFGHFNLDARLRGYVYVVGSAEGGCGFTDAGVGGFGNCTTSIGSSNPNPKGQLDARLTGDFSMPFHEPLSVGISFYDAYIWYYNVGGGAVDSSEFVQTDYGMAPNNPSAMLNSQPYQQVYGYEIDVRYAFPSLKGFKTDLSFTFAPLGDATLGWTPVVHSDGSHAVLPYYRQTAEFYFSLNGHY